MSRKIPPPRNVLVVVHRPDLAAAVTAALLEVRDARCCGVGSTLAEGVDQLRSTHVDVVLVELELPGTQGVEALDAVRHVAPEVPVLVLAHGPDVGLLQEATRAGASGFATVTTRAASIVGLTQMARRAPLVVEGSVALEMARGTANPPSSMSSVRGRPPLTPREHEVLTLLGRGLDTTTIARRLGVSVHTTRGHVKKILAKLHAHTQLEAVVNASELGMLPNLRRP
jgi:DNA-binding NarL/FixJ family response regulator